MTDKDSATPQVRDVLLCVLVVQVMFALTAAALLIVDPDGILNDPTDQMLAALLVLTPIMVAGVLAFRFRRGHRDERNRARKDAHLMDTVLSTSHESVWAVDDQGLFTVCSPGSAALLGWEPSELLGRRYDVVIDSPDLTRAKQKWPQQRDRAGAASLCGAGTVTGARSGWKSRG